MQQNVEPSSISRVLRDTLAVVMAGGRGTRLAELTNYRSKPAVPFAGKYRIIDFTLSNCINSGLRRIAILTQYWSHSLIQHIHRGWSLYRPEFGEFVEILPAQERYSASSWYKGTADSVYQNLDIIREHRPRFVLILAGDHIYKMDYAAMIAMHLEQQANVTVGCVEVPVDQSKEFGIMDVDQENRIVGFKEKPAVTTATPDRGEYLLASMGIYLFHADFLYEVLESDARNTRSRHDFGGDIIPKLFPKNQVVAYPFRDPVTGGPAYWRDVGTIDAYWRANLEIASITPPLNLYDMDWPIHSVPRHLPPAKFVFDDEGRRGMATDSLVSAGCILSGAHAQRCVLSNNVRLECFTEIIDSVVLPDVHIGEHCRIRNAVIDSGCDIPPRTTIGYEPQKDRERFHVSNGGVVLVCPDMLGQSASHAA
jgi:glucose-1-phosphate adenylyltransferase